MSYPLKQTRLALMHWLAVALSMLSLLTGLRIHASSQMLGSPPLLDWLPEGPVHRWHLASAGAWLLLALAYALHRRASPSHNTRQAATAQPMARAARRLTEAGPWLIGAVMLSGTIGFLGDWPRAWAPSEALRQLHRWMGLGLGLWLLAHVALHLLALRGAHILRTLWPARARRSWVQGALLLPLLLGLGGWALRDTLNSATLPTLQAASIGLDRLITLDGVANEAEWSQAKPTHITTQGVGPAAASVTVTVRALQQGEVMHFVFSWPDPSHSMKHLPLRKTEQGWVVQHQGYDRHDEQSFYEDKLAVMWADKADAAGQASMHMGRQPIGGRPESATGRGLHAAEPGQLLDVWHWKSVRLHGTQQLDDNHFGAPYPDVPGDIRYTGGYKPDPALSGGYSENWLWFRPGVVTPKRLPKDPALLAPFQREPAAHEAQPVWGMSWYESRPYAAELDTYPVGTLMPSVLWTTVLEGDRGDVRAQGHWANGHWTLEVTRGMKAESAFDLDLRDGLFLWVAVFDHAQTRHTYHLRPVRLRLP